MSMLPISTAGQLLDWFKELQEEGYFEEVADLPVRIEDEDGTIDEQVVGVDNVNGVSIIIGSLPDHLFESHEAPSRSFQELVKDVEEADVTWIIIPFSNAEMRWLAPDHGIMQQGATYWEEIRKKLGLSDRPYRMRNGTYTSIRQGDPWATGEALRDVRRLREVSP